jgi:2-polyprenyl-6-methoxyphenol hydroxylase-like FAD-dependent oxidoreductase
MEPTSSPPRTAIVMGASIAGLWTARALADHFEQVVLIERDVLPGGAEFRPGVPQARQFHGLLLGGLRQMQTWFPGLDEELLEAGAVPFDMTGDAQVRVRDRWLRRFPSGQRLLSCSRLLLEARIRRRLRAIPQVCFVEGLEVTGLETDAEGKRVRGVRARRRAPGAPDEETLLSAGLVVDALGRRSQTPAWLEALGYAPPQESEVDSFLGYVTRRYRRPPGAPLLMIVSVPPDHPYGGLVLPEENDTMMVMMGGVNRRYPPTDEQGFLEFAAHLGPEFQGVIEGAEPLSQAYGYRGISSRWRHYERLERWPERFVVLGDAFCSFNPIYGQGMTVAAMSAAALARELGRRGGKLDGLAKPMLQQISRITEGAWLLATSADLGWPETAGGSGRDGPLDRFARWYIYQLLEAMTVDHAVRMRFNAVNQLIEPASALFAPGTFLRVMVQSARRRKEERRKRKEGKWKVDG